MKILKFRPRKKKSKKKSPKKKEEEDKKEEDKKPPRNYKDGSTATHYCFELVAAGLKQDDRDVVAKNLLTWFIVNVDQETLTRFIRWIVKKENE